MSARPTSLTCHAEGLQERASSSAAGRGTRPASAPVCLYPAPLGGRVGLAGREPNRRQDIMPHRPTMRPGNRTTAPSNRCSRARLDFADHIEGHTPTCSIDEKCDRVVVFCSVISRSVITAAYGLPRGLPPISSHPSGNVGHCQARMSALIAATPSRRSRAPRACPASSRHAPHGPARGRRRTQTISASAGVSRDQSMPYRSRSFVMPCPPARSSTPPHRAAILSVDDLRREITQRLRRIGVDVSQRQPRRAGFQFDIAALDATAAFSN